MKRRNFFKTLAGLIGAAIVVPEAIRGALSKPDVHPFMKGPNNLPVDGREYYYKEISYPRPPLFVITGVENSEIPTHTTIRIREEVPSGKSVNYFRMNNEIRILSQHSRYRNVKLIVDEDSLHIVSHPPTCQVSPLAGEEAILKLISVHDRSCRIEPGDKVILMNSLSATYDMVPRDGILIDISGNNNHLF